MEETEKKPKLDSMNYNDRADGYGFGESESNDNDHEYEKDPHFTSHCKDMGDGYRCHRNEPYTLNEFGLRNQYGPVDQYSFREIHFIRRGKVTKDTKEAS